VIRYKTTITRPDRDRLLEVTQAKANTVRWALFIDELEREIQRARVVDPARVCPHVVTMHSTVKIRDLGRGRSEVYTLVYPEEADLNTGKLSVLTPMGTALVGASVGDVIQVVGAAGPRAIFIDALLYQPEAAERAREKLGERCLST
jgi:regulator of nucleoside diphosphate kinase